MPGETLQNKTKLHTAPNSVRARIMNKRESLSQSFLDSFARAGTEARLFHGILHFAFRRPTAVPQTSPQRHRRPTADPFLILVPRASSPLAGGAFVPSLRRLRGPGGSGDENGHFEVQTVGRYQIFQIDPIPIRC